MNENIAQIGCLFIATAMCAIVYLACTQVPSAIVRHLKRKSS